MTYILTFLTGLSMMVFTVFILYWFGRLVTPVIKLPYRPRTTSWVEVSITGLVSLILLILIILFIYVVGALVETSIGMPF